MVKAKIMHDHGIPISVINLNWNMSRDIVINLLEVLHNSVSKPQYRDSI
jgi:hypothetical protein